MSAIAMGKKVLIQGGGEGSCDGLHIFILIEYCMIDHELTMWMLIIEYQFLFSPKLEGSKLVSYKKQTRSRNLFEM